MKDISLSECTNLYPLIYLNLNKATLEDIELWDYQKKIIEELIIALGGTSEFSEEITMVDNNKFCGESHV